MKKQKILFSLKATLIPVAILALLELGLWIFNAYPAIPLFLEIDEDDNALIQINSRIGERYFNKTSMSIPKMYSQKFSAEKADGTLRIFCVGGSSTAGFPYDMTAPFSQQLKFLLEANYPDRQFEVINMGLSALNSFTIVDWIPDILRQQPDLIILYMGHNEFYGAYGAGSTLSLGQDGRIIRLVLKLQKLRVVRMFTSLFRSFSESPPLMSSSNFMEQMVDDKFIELTSNLRTDIRTNFAANLDVILGACKSAGVPVIMSNLVSNLKDQPPLDITSRPEHTSSKANKLYLKGVREFEQGDTATAYISLNLARNQDQVPFRGNDYLNEILINRASHFNLTFVDMIKAFRKTSSFGIPGNDLFCDHLHPNPTGYYLMAREYYSALERTGLLTKVILEEQPLQSRFVTDLDWEIGYLRTFKLIHHWPFANDEVEYDDYRAHYGDETAKIAKEYLLEHHVWEKAHSDMANYYLKQDSLKKASMEYMAITAMYPEKTEYYTKLVECAKKMNQWDVVEQTCRKALTTATMQGMFNYHLALAEALKGDLDAAQKHILAAMEAPEMTQNQSANAHFAYARFLVDMQKPSEAAAVLSDLVRDVPGFIQAKELLDQLLN